MVQGNKLRALFSIIEMCVRFGISIENKNHLKIHYKMWLHTFSIQINTQ